NGYHTRHHPIPYTPTAAYHCIHSSTYSPFFFYCHRHHRHLHSFPTRRSSDLGQVATYITLSHIDLRWPSPCPVGSQPRAWKDPRSEEHTSELQSPYELVCRLLLEKKNISQRCAHGRFSWHLSDHDGS